MICNMRNASCFCFFPANMSLTNKFAQNIVSPLTYCVPMPTRRHYGALNQLDSSSCVQRYSK